MLAGIATYMLGSLGNRVTVRQIGVVGFSLLAIGVILHIYVSSLVTLIVAMSIWGFGIGAMMFVTNIVWAEYFGRDHVGEIRGFVTPITLLLGASGAPIAGVVFDQVGSYDAVWWGSAALMFLCAGMIGFSRKPVPVAA